MQSEADEAANATSAYESAISQNNGVISKESFKRLDLIESMGNIQKENDALAGQNEGLKAEIAQQTSGISQLTKIVNDKGKAVKDGIDAEKELTGVVKDRAEEEASKKDAVGIANVSAFKEILGQVKGDLDKFVKALDDMINAVRKTQQQFGIAAGQAAQLKIDNFVSSFKSFATTVLTLGKKAGVTAQEIENAQAAFQAEFGGVITSGAAENIARQAKEMGVGAGELAKARRVFMTQTMGNTGQAAAQQDKFINEFKKKGLTSKDAMAAIGQNSELLARNGTRFATSFARAAAEARKIGVDLGKVDQVGDNIIGDFEGFLEKQAELGAMGFGFDSNKLAEVAETGDTGALFNELRSQLASTGKDITKLRRSEQLALSGAFGISMEELQRMAAPGGGSGEELTDQEKTNKFLERLVNSGEVVAKILGGMAAIAGGIQVALLTRIAYNTMNMSGALGNFTRATGGAPAAGGTPSVPGGTSAPSGMTKALGGAKMGAKVGALTGIVSGIAEYQESGDIKKALGRGLANMAGSVIGGALGSFIPIPGVGTMLGATAGSFAANWLFDKVFGTADDLMSKPGYGERTLVTPTRAIALNNNDNIVAYADDLMATSAGLQFGALGQFAPQTPTSAPVNNINVDLSKLEAKLDAVVRAIGSMDVKLDGNKVGQVIVSNDQRAAQAGVFRAQRL
jgi:putative intracellular protease/amidase